VTRLEFKESWDQYMLDHPDRYANTLRLNGASAYALGTSAYALGTSKFDLGTSKFDLGTSKHDLGTDKRSNGIAKPMPLGPERKKQKQRSKQAGGTNAPMCYAKV
jgi:hypothetical protein